MTWRRDIQVSATATSLFVFLLFGGGTRQGSSVDLLPFFCSLFLLAIAIPRAFDGLRDKPLILAILLGVVGVPLLQLLPLPPWLWAALPGRNNVQELSTTLGAAQVWRPISLASEMTFRAFLALLAPLSMFLAVQGLDTRARTILIAICATIAVVSVFVATIQIFGGESSSLYFFEFTNIGKGVGFFANANHQAAFLYAVMPLTAAVLAKSDIRLPVHPLFLMACTCAALALGLSMTGSRTALLLGLVSIAYVFFRAQVALSGMPRRYFGWLAGGLVAVLMSLAAGTGLLTILQRFEQQDILEDARWTIAGQTWQMVKSYFPYGSGFGTFVPVYQSNEQAQNILFQEVNRAHNDWLELMLEGGVFSAILIGLFLIWLGTNMFKLVRDRLGGFWTIEGAASLTLILICIHSFWDYPLRTTAVSSVFALCVALLLPAPDTQTRRH